MSKLYFKNPLNKEYIEINGTTHSYKMMLRSIYLLGLDSSNYKVSIYLINQLLPEHDKVTLVDNATVYSKGGKHDVSYVIKQFSSNKTVYIKEGNSYNTINEYKIYTTNSRITKRLLEEYKSGDFSGVIDLGGYDNVRFSISSNGKITIEGVPNPLEPIDKETLIKYIDLLDGEGKDVDERKFDKLISKLLFDTSTNLTLMETFYHEDGESECDLIVKVDTLTEIGNVRALTHSKDSSVEGMELANTINVDEETNTLKGLLKFLFEFKDGLIEGGFIRHN